MHEVLVLGGGVAGLTTALHLAEAGLPVIMVTKSPENATRIAQGGIACATTAEDSLESHLHDTLAAGAGLSEESAVQILCGNARTALDWAVSLGANFDRLPDGALAIGREAAHAFPRIWHAGGDATGSVLHAALARAATKHPGITHLSAEVQVLQQADDGVVRGVQLVDGTEISGSAVVLATGGVGGLFTHTTNPLSATGDGLALAYRVGATLADLEFVQFHPTMLRATPPALLTEALRGEGAVIRNARGERFLTRVHVDAELAPRDVVATAIALEQELHGPVVLDATELGADFLTRRFPTVVAHCRAAGFDLATTPVPITPAAHFHMGGVATDLWGQSTVRGLYAVGEVASTGLHGANRLASNSLLEGLVFGRRVAEAIATRREPEPPHVASHAHLVHFAAPSTEPTSVPTSVPTHVGGLRHSEPQAPFSADLVRDVMWRGVGILRNASDLEIAEKALRSFCPQSPHDRRMVIAAFLIATAALAREESRGAHRRSDFPLSESPYHSLIRSQS